MKYLLFFNLLFCFTAFSQTPGITDSIIHLKEVVIESKEAKAKTANIKTKGEEVASHSFTTIQTHVSLLKNIPEGNLKSVTFYFNSGLINLNKKALNVDYKDTTLALVVYNVGPDGKPGTLLTENQLQFTVNKEHRGGLELDLTPLHLPTQSQLFIGIQSTDDHTAQQVILKVRENKAAESYIKNKGSNEWTGYTDGTDFKFDIKMAVKVALTTQ
jgi:hypothetical protein